MAKYKVKKGDSWARIAGYAYKGQYGWDERQAQRMMGEVRRANMGVSGGLRPGMTINLPAAVESPYIAAGGMAQDLLKPYTTKTTPPPFISMDAGGVNKNINKPGLKRETVHNKMQRKRRRYRGKTGSTSSDTGGGYYPAPGGTGDTNG